MRAASALGPKTPTPFSRDERSLGPDHRQVDVVGERQRQETIPVVGAYRVAPAERRDSRVPRSRVELRQARALGEAPRERVFTRPRADDEHVHAASLLRGFDGCSLAYSSPMEEPGLDEHEWITEWEQIEPELQESPTEALADADELIARMMVARGFPLEESDGEEVTDPEIVRSFEEARRVTRQIDKVGEPLDPGDIPDAVEAYRDLFRDLLDYGATPGVP
jgi:hypothetical protein